MDIHIVDFRFIRIIEIRSIYFLYFTNIFSFIFKFQNHKIKISKVFKVKQQIDFFFKKKQLTTN